MGLFKKGTPAYSIFKFKCPKCHKGDLYPTATFSFQKPFEMYDNCEHCGQAFFPEPGFYYGAMYISYMFFAFFSLGFVAVAHWVLGYSTGVSIIMLMVIGAIFFVYIFRLARSIYLTMNVAYEPKYDKQ